MNEYRIAVIPGDGIGQEVVPEGIRVLDAAANKFGLRSSGRHWIGVAGATPRQVR